MTTEEQTGGEESGASEPAPEGGDVEPAFDQTVPEPPPPAILSGDWTRYGLGQGAPSASRNRDSSRPSVVRRPESRDDAFLDYRRENAARLRHAPSGRSARFTANVVSAAVVGVVALAVVVAGLVTSRPGPTPPPSARPATASPSRTPAASSTISVAVPQRGGQIQVVIDVPVAVRVPDRSLASDDGTILYLVGGTGGVAVDPQSGAAGTVFGGEAFAHGTRRAVVAGGSLWLSWWPTTFTTCGPSCWAEATTYRLNVGTGKIQTTYPKTYLVGLATDGLWLATAAKVQRLDLKTMTVAAGTPWSADEPRVGCGSLWSLSAPKTGQPLLSKVDIATGQIANSVAVTGTYGPTTVSAMCWMMTGADGISQGEAVLERIDKDGSLDASNRTSSTLLILDGEFWTYATGGVIQRYAPGTHTAYGPSFKVAAAPTDNDATQLFASMGRLWMLDGLRLDGFDVPLGSANAAN